jgi:hypothetical protein
VVAHLVSTVSTFGAWNNVLKSLQDDTRIHSPWNCGTSLGISFNIAGRCTANSLALARRQAPFVSDPISEPPSGLYTSASVPFIPHSWIQPFHAWRESARFVHALATSTCYRFKRQSLCIARLATSRYCSQCSALQLLLISS